MSDIQTMTTKQAIRYAKRQARSCFSGIAIPTATTFQEVASDLDPTLRFLLLADRIDTVDGPMLRSEKVLKFNRRALMVEKKKKSKSAGDCSIVRIGEPGSKARLDAYASFYQSNGCAERGYEGNISPFMEE